MPTHTYHRFWLNRVLCDDGCPSLLGSLLAISPHMHSIWMPLIRNYLFSYRFLSGIWLSCKGGSENLQREKPSHSAGANTCLLFIYPHLAHFLPRLRDHQSVSYVPDTDSFWQCYWYQLILICFLNLPLWQFNSSLDLFENFYGLKRDRTHSRIFTRISLQIRNSRWEHRCSSYFCFNQDAKIHFKKILLD